ncbi:hypothetical protein TUM4445_02060 [Shewanella sp. MBTL60-112-B2]|nr:hypothetical protein TUM4444_00310 [Shewanella sp. MBTL60-112-B1]GIU24677.1 hypothetical protein TUM4445_02060 [Shewanella sp. MBTL60-112-B2]
MQLKSLKLTMIDCLRDFKCALKQYWKAEAKQPQLVEISKGICEANSLWQV